MFVFLSFVWCCKQAPLKKKELLFFLFYSHTLVKIWKLKYFLNYLGKPSIKPAMQHSYHSSTDKLSTLIYSSIKKKLSSSSLWLYVVYLLFGKYLWQTRASEGGECERVQEIITLQYFAEILFYWFITSNGCRNVLLCHRWTLRQSNIRNGFHPCYKGSQGMYVLSDLISFYYVLCRPSFLAKPTSNQTRFVPACTRRDLLT